MDDPLPLSRILGRVAEALACANCADTIDEAYLIAVVELGCASNRHA